MLFGAKARGGGVQGGGGSARGGGGAGGVGHEHKGHCFFFMYGPLTNLVEVLRRAARECPKRLPGGRACVCREGGVGSIQPSG